MPKDGEASAIGRSRTVSGRYPERTAEMLGATLLPGWTSGGMPPGTELPPLWHWAAFPPFVPMEALGEDGHPALGDFLPDLGLGRRMWAGGAVKLVRPIQVDAALTLTSTIVRVDHKETAGGPMAVVALEHRLEGESGVAVEETQNIVYLRIPDRFVAPRKQPAPTSKAFEETVAIDPVRLFRFSAATFNGHRIHYDRPYATEIEHYPGLVVHGPLQAILLAGAAARHRGRAPSEFTYRGVHPMFDNHDLRLVGVEEEDGSMTLCTAAPEGHQGMQAKAVWA